MVINTSGQIDGTTVYGELTVTASSRSASGFLLNLSHLLTMGGYTGAGYETYTAYITISGTGISTQTITMVVKPKATGLSSGATLTTTGSPYISTTSASATTATISYYIQTSANGDKTTTGSDTLNISAAIITPTAPSTVIAKSNVGASTTAFYIGYNPDSAIVVSCYGGSNISKYRYQVSINGGAYSTLTDTTSSSYTYNVSDRSFGDTIVFRVYAISSTNMVSTSATTSTTLTVQYRIPEAPTFLTPAQKTVVDADTIINCSWEAPPQTITSYSIRVVVNGEVKNSTVLGSTTTSWSYARLQENETAYFEIAATNASGSSQYIKSPVYTTIALMPAMVPVYVMVNGSWQPISVTTLINNE